MNIATTIKTPRHHDANRPFGAIPMIKQPVKPTDPDTLTICNDPLPAGRASAKVMRDLLGEAHEFLDQDQSGTPTLEKQIEAALRGAA